MDDVTKTALIREKAASLYQADADRGLVPAPQGTGAGSASSVGQPQGAGNSGAQTPQPQSSAPTGKKTSVSLDALLADPVAGPQARIDLQTPEGRARIISKIPALKNEVERYPLKEFLRGVPGEGAY